MLLTGRLVHEPALRGPLGALAVIARNGPTSGCGRERRASVVQWITTGNSWRTQYYPVCRARADPGCTKVPGMVSTPGLTGYAERSELQVGFR